MNYPCLLAAFGGSLKRGLSACYQLKEMRGLVSEARFEEFVDFPKDKHSNRPAFLDELEKAGF
ncbi:zinc finger SWIM domain protein [Halalkaliarchaeum desulfuricum]|uniref:Zinc finger SWIM domain protein n=1 Tax=Halalkaliarchaeum desulfuricum TaxID=2055893 RepID=A0A343TJQ9_9EURY|nr:hypothetical protein [Halalkaliarchaeum desulfuricum]AUX09331.1 zinc finger SWIM domain protein [Halalkaliarchaeum desulfuricum]